MFKPRKHFNFVHGTALKMYIKEKEGDPEYPMRFLTKCQGSGVFDGLSKTSGVWVNSEDSSGGRGSRGVWMCVAKEVRG